MTTLGEGGSVTTLGGAGVRGTSTRVDLTQRLGAPEEWHLSEHCSELLCAKFNGFTDFEYLPWFLFLSTLEHFNLIFTCEQVTLLQSTCKPE